MKDITEEQKNRLERPENQLKDFTKKNYSKSIQDILKLAPAMICTVRGPEHIFEVANEKYRELVGHRDIIGKPVREVLPEVENQGFFEILDRVYETGEPFVGKEVPIKIKLLPNQQEKLAYLDFVYQPTSNDEGKIDGIFVHAIDVTEKVQVRQRIEKSEVDLRNYIDAMPAIIWITDEKGHSSYLNKNWYNYTGQGLREAEGFGWLKAIHPEDGPDAERRFREANDERKPYRTTFRLRNKDGGYRWVIDRGSPRINADGDYEGMVGTVVDVHEEKVKEQQIREKEHRIRSIVEESTVATALYTGYEMKIELANDAMIQLWGKDRSVIGKNLREALPELDDQPFHEILQKVFTTGETYWGKEDKVDLMINNQLQTGYFNFSYKPLRNEKGEIYGILNMAVDMTEMVESRMLLQQSESHFRQMADLMPDKVTNTDSEGNIIYLNQNWVAYTGLNSDELKNGGLQKFIHPDHIDEFKRRWSKSLETGDYFEMELCFKDKSGKYRWHLGRAEAVKNENGSVKMWVGTSTDIQKIKEEEKRKEDFLKMVSHELKTPVTSIKGYVQLLLSLLKSGKENMPASTPIIPSLERINHQVGRLTRLISEMLDLSRLEDSKMELHWETFKLNDLVTDTVQDISYTNTQHKIQVFHDFHCEVKADKDRIGQVVINLITNAIKYSPESQDIEVRVKQTGDDEVAVSVKDYGIGIAKKDQKNIFKRFYRIGGKSEETYAGFGIGLYLAQDVVQRHNGTIAVKSKEGKGSEFTFTLKIASN